MVSVSKAVVGLVSLCGMCSLKWSWARGGGEQASFADGTVGRDSKGE